MGDFIRIVSQRQVEKQLTPEHLMPYCATVDFNDTCEDHMIVTKSKLKLRCQMNFLMYQRVVIAGQCTKPEIMVAVAQVPNERGQVILAGDLHQLQSVVINKYALERCFSQSFLERILSRPPYLRMMIDLPLVLIVAWLQIYSTISGRCSL
ncbi:hypothetical protein GQX74_015227 [Glossina fuscipes]|nr:hypothetical protein GQX74_015227 [Glossina fuscipes]